MASEHLIGTRDNGSGKLLLGGASLTGGGGPGGFGSFVQTNGWSALLKRMTRRDQVTANPGLRYQITNGAVVLRDPSAFFPPMPPNNMIYRIRAGIAAEYVSGDAVSRVGWGLYKGFSDFAVGAPSQPLDLGFIGFLWYQVGGTSVNWRAVAANHAGDNKFDQDTGKIAPGIPYNVRVDFDGRIGRRKIVWYIDEVQVATFTPGNDALGGSSQAAMSLGMGVNAHDSNVCAGHSSMLGEDGWELVVTDGEST